MQILMLGNSLTLANNLPQMIADLTHGKVWANTRGGARLSEHLNRGTQLGARTQEAPSNEEVGLCRPAGDEPWPHHRSKKLFPQCPPVVRADS